MSAKKQQIKRKKKGTSKPRIADVKTQNPKHATCVGSDVRSDTQINLTEESDFACCLQKCLSKYAKAQT